MISIHDCCISLQWEKQWRSETGRSKRWHAYLPAVFCYMCPPSFANWEFLLYYCTQSQTSLAKHTATHPSLKPNSGPTQLLIELKHVPLFFPKAGIQSFLQNQTRYVGVVRKAPRGGLHSLKSAFISPYLANIGVEGGGTYQKWVPISGWCIACADVVIEIHWELHHDRRLS